MFIKICYVKNRWKVCTNEKVYLYLHLQNINDIIQLNAELANQIKLISGNTDLMKKALDYIKSLNAHLAPSKKESESERTKKFIDSFAGKWIDKRSADEMISDIYASRKNKDYDELIKILNE